VGLPTIETWTCFRCRHVNNSLAPSECHNVDNEICELCESFRSDKQAQTVTRNPGVSASGDLNPAVRLSPAVQRAFHRADRLLQAAVDDDAVEIEHPSSLGFDVDGTDIFGQTALSLGGS
jgi:hypothetical protein